MKIIFLLIGLSLFQAVQGFCFYNYNDEDFKVIQQWRNCIRNFGNRYQSGAIKKGGKSCCNYQNKDCVENQQPDAIAWFEISTNCRGDRWARNEYAMNLPAGGWMEFHGTKTDVEILAFWANGTKFDYRQDINGSVTTE